MEQVPSDCNQHKPTIVDRHCATKRLELQVRASELSVGDIQPVASLERDAHFIDQHTLSVEP
jgi:hypothetical protein